jgi:hypothetical protein
MVNMSTEVDDDDDESEDDEEEASAEISPVRQPQNFSSKPKVGASSKVVPPPPKNMSAVASHKAKKTSEDYR